MGLLRKAVSKLWGAFVCFMDHISLNREYEATHPELTDEEYLALYDWPVDPVIALKVREVLAYVTGMEENQIRPDDRLLTDLNMK